MKQWIQGSKTAEPEFEHLPPSAPRTPPHQTYGGSVVSIASARLAGTGSALVPKGGSALVPVGGSALVPMGGSALVPMGCLDQECSGVSREIVEDLVHGGSQVETEA